MPEKLLSVDELAEYLDVPKGTIYRWQHRNEGPTARKVGRYLRFRQADVEAWLDQRSARAS